MGWKKKPFGYKWDYKKIDTDALNQQCTTLYRWAFRRRNDHEAFADVMHFSNMVLYGVYRGSILVDLDYDRLFRAVESLYDYPGYDRMMEALEAIYGIANIETLAQDHIECRRKEDKWLVEKGFKNATNN